MRDKYFIIFRVIYILVKNKQTDREGGLEIQLTKFTGMWNSSKHKNKLIIFQVTKLLLKQFSSAETAKENSFGSSQLRSSKYHELCADGHGRVITNYTKHYQCGQFLN